MNDVGSSTSTAFCDEFIFRLEQLVVKEDRGALALLRRGLGKRVPFETYRFMPFRRTRWQEAAALVVGPLFALWHQGKDALKDMGDQENFGASMEKLVQAMKGEGTAHEDALKRVERRFAALLNSHADDLDRHLRHAVSLLKSKDVAVNWRLLLRDLLQWTHEDRWVQRSWARAFWAPITVSSRVDTGASDEPSGEEDVAGED